MTPQERVKLEKALEDAVTDVLAAHVPNATPIRMAIVVDSLMTREDDDGTPHAGRHIGLYNPGAHAPWEIAGMLDFARRVYLAGT